MKLVAQGPDEHAQCGLHLSGRFSHTACLRMCVSLCSGGTFPDDDGSRQVVKNSLFVGESENRGMPFPDGRIWGPSGLDHSGRTLPRGV